MSDVWDRTAEFLSDNLRPVTAIALLALFLPSAVDTVLKLAATGTGTGTQLAVAIVSFVLSVLAVWGQLALTMLALDPALDARGAFRTAGPRIVPLIGIGVLVLLALFVVSLPLIILLAGDGMDMTAAETGTLPALSTASAVVAVAYLLVGLPLLIWLGTRLAVTTPVIAAERRGSGALARSFRLTRGHAGRIFGVLLLILVVGGVAILAVRLVVGTLLRFAIDRPDGFDPATATTSVVVALASTGLTVVLVAFVAKLYLALDARDAEHERITAAG